MKLPERLTIPKTVRVSAPNKMIFIDTETQAERLEGVNIKHVLQLGHAIFYERERPKHKEKRQDYKFSNAFDLWQWVNGHVNKRETVYIFAHNISFDFLVLEGFRLLPCLDFTLQSIYSKFTTTVMRFANENKRLVFVDTMNYYPVSLDKIATSLGLSKTEIDFNACTKEELERHCAADCEIIYQAIRRLLDETVHAGMGSFKLTASSISHSIYRHSYMRDKIVVSHDPKVVAFENEAYTGGYTQLHKLVVPGDPELFKLDVNSMYPSVMLDQQFPTQLIEFAGRVSLRDMERFLKGYSVIARVDLHTDEAIYPMKYQTFTAYPIGDFTTTLTTPMLQYALDRGHIKQVDWMSVYLNAPIFREFITDIYKRRLSAKAEADTARELFYKAIGNTLYGKFGQRQTETKRIGDADLSEFAVYDASDPRSGEEWREVHAGGSVIFIYKRGEARYTSYAIAAHITDYARAKLFDLRRSAGLDHVFYMDTDSLIVDRQGKLNLDHHVDPERLGSLKIEDQGGYFVGLAKKDYILGDARKVKGFNVQDRPKDKSVFTMFENVSLLGAARRDLRGGAFWREVQKYYNPFVCDVTITKDGDTMPLEMPRDEHLLGHKRFTKVTVKALVKSTLNVNQRHAVTDWLGME